MIIFSTILIYGDQCGWHKSLQKYPKKTVLFIRTGKQHNLLLKNFFIIGFTSELGVVWKTTAIQNSLSARKIFADGAQWSSSAQSPKN